MKPEDLMHAMNHLDPDLVERAEQPGTRRKPRVRRIAVLAACLAAMVVGVSASPTIRMKCSIWMWGIRAKSDRP